MTVGASFDAQRAENKGIGDESNFSGSAFWFPI
jgi:hypothetical protein